MRSPESPTDRQIGVVNLPEKRAVEASSYLYLIYAMWGMGAASSLIRRVQTHGIEAVSCWGLWSLEACRASQSARVGRDRLGRTAIRLFHPMNIGQKHG